MIRAKVTIYQRVQLKKTVEVEGQDIDDVIMNARNEVPMCLADNFDDYIDFDDYDNVDDCDIEILEENEE